HLHLLIGRREQIHRRQAAGHHHGFRARPRRDRSFRPRYRAQRSARSRQPGARRRELFLCRRRCESQRPVRRGRIRDRREDGAGLDAARQRFHLLRPATRPRREGGHAGDKSPACPTLIGRGARSSLPPGPPTGWTRMKELDDTDRQLLALLQKDDRLSLAELGKSVGLAPSSVNERIKRLTTRGVIEGFHAHVVPESLGLDLLAFVFVGWSNPATEPPFLARVAAAPAVLECHHVTGSWNYLLKVRLPNTRDLERF